MSKKYQNFQDEDLSNKNINLGNTNDHSGAVSSDQVKKNDSDSKVIISRFYVFRIS